jgi:hypothetical protein
VSEQPFTVVSRQDVILFKADSKEHLAVVGEPVAATALPAWAMIRTVGDTEYQICISLHGGFVARPVVAA